VPGERRELLATALAAYRAYEAAHEAWQRGLDDALNQAKGQARAAYDRAHPSPTMAQMEELIKTVEEP